MRAPRSRDRSPGGMNMTPMIDIVFQLIIFFLLASHLAQREARVEVDLPTAATGQRLDPHPQVRRLVVHVPRDGEMMVGGRAVPAAQLPRIVAAEKELGGGDLEVRIRSDRAVPYRAVEPILVACARSGVWRITFAVVRDRG